MNKEAGKKIIAERVEEFEKNKAILTKKGHGETNIRSNYIDIMFNALGWNMKSHYEVVREFSQRDKSTDGGTKKVDYAFKLNGKLKFFIEAKEASVDLEKDKAAIFQAKRYAYSSNGKAPIVILTDFEEFRVFNVIKAPLMDNTDRELLKSHTMKYTDYLEKWDLLWDTFSREAVENGSLDKLKGKIDKNTKTMDVDFLEQITSWRESLAKNIAIRNENLNVDEINEAVQRILDRLVFIRNLEDREIEPENTLLDKAKKAENIYKSIIPIFNSLNTTYNGLLFKKHFSENIEVDDKTIKDIIRQMCYPVSPFQFDVIEPEILGRIYEKFLGSKIRLTDNHRAKIEEKIEVRKAGGVYYTPEYIVEYIVQNTVGKRIEGLTPEEIKNIKILDPACGSGSFLIGAYSYLLDYHHKWYSKNQKDKTYQADWYKTKDGEIKVRLDKRGDILRNNIFGVDIDKEATEVTIMSLYLKMLDDGFDKGERDLFFVKGSILPDMIENIKCGNSLISSDYFDGKLEIDIHEMKEIKPFNWNSEFPFFSKHKFDCVIGNPPYLYSAGQYNSEYFSNRYKLSQYQTDFYVYFIEKSLNLSVKDGYFSFIVPDSWLNSQYFSLLRKNILTEHKLESISLFDFLVFEKVALENSIFIIRPLSKSDEVDFYKFISQDEYKIVNKISVHDILENEIIDYKYSTSNQKILNKIENGSTSLDKLFDVNRGLHAYRTDGYGKSKFNNGKQTKRDKEEKSYHAKEILDKTYLPEIKGKDVFRFYNTTSGEYLSYGDWLAEPRTPEFFYNPKVVLRKILGEKIHCTFISKPAAIDQSLYIIINKNQEVNENELKSILCLMSSKMAAWYLRVKYSIYDSLYPWYTKKQLADFPVKLTDEFSSLSNQIINAYEQLNLAKSESDKELYKKQIILLENKIDSLVYKTYGLTDEEIQTIESI
jgi:type I restriction-modification system DNA methylase subunit